ncbi:hypothetical protein [Micromonospora sp. RHAY321]|uniref:DUF6924 domain-containing protein n=1 Tax=Micromonospora sp. RHAY321 TaxID=2944807 RepID=UPI0035B1847D
MGAERGVAQNLHDHDRTARCRRPTCATHRDRRRVVVDAVTVSLSERPLLVVNLNEGYETGPFRALPRQVQAIENNLSIANMDFHEFARSAGPDGVFRGF